MTDYCFLFNKLIVLGQIYKLLMKLYVQYASFSMLRTCETILSEIPDRFTSIVMLYYNLLHFFLVDIWCHVWLDKDDHDLLQWALAIESLECGNPGSDKSFGMQQRPDGDIEIDEKFWEQDFNICQQNELKCISCAGP